MATPTQRTLNLLRTQGYNPWIVEKFNSFSGRRTDLFNIIDILFLTPKGVIGIQSTGVDFSSHVKKLINEEKVNTKHWLRTRGNELILIGWRKTKLKRGGKMMVYKPRIGIIFLNSEGAINIKEVTYKWLRKRNQRL